MSAFSRELERSLHRALDLARKRHHEYATLEHLLLALSDDPDAIAVLRACNVDIEKLKGSLVSYIENELDLLVTSEEQDAKPTAGFQRVIQRAVIHVQSAGREEVTGANVLVAIFAERESHAAYFLQEQEMTRYDAVNFMSMGIAKRPGPSRPVRLQSRLIILSSEKDQGIESWLTSVAGSTNFSCALFRRAVRPGVRIQNALMTLLNDSHFTSHIIAVVTPSFLKSPIFEVLGKEKFFESVVSNRVFVPLVVGPRVKKQPLADIAQVSLSNVSAEQVCDQIFSAFGYKGHYECFPELFEAALRKRSSTKDDNGRGKGTDKTARERSFRSDFEGRLPGEEDFTWQSGAIHQSEFFAIELKTGDVVLKPVAFLNDYSRLVCEFGGQLSESNHSSYVKVQSKLLLDEISLGPKKWDPQTIDRRVRALFRLLPSDECPMNRIIELNFQELKEYQSNFRAVYPIVIDRDRAMRGFKVPESAPLDETQKIAKALSGDSELVGSEVPKKLESAVEELKEIESQRDDPRRDAGLGPKEIQRKRVIFKLAIMLNSIWQKLKDPPELVRTVESYRKLYELAAPIFQKIVEWISHF
jgi:hypothetical protein